MPQLPPLVVLATPERPRRFCQPSCLRLRDVRCVPRGDTPRMSARVYSPVGLRFFTPRSLRGVLRMFRQVGRRFSSGWCVRFFIGWCVLPLPLEACFKVSVEVTFRVVRINFSENPK